MATGRRPRRRTTGPTVLPIKGRTGAPPKCPYPLGEAGSAWWKWAWHTPTAAAWNPGDLYAVARRALIEDHLAAATAKDKPSARTIGDLTSLALRCDTALGLTPKGRKDLGLKTSQATDLTPVPTEPVNLDAFRAGLTETSERT